MSALRLPHVQGFPILTPQRLRRFARRRKREVESPGLMSLRLDSTHIAYTTIYKRIFIQAVGLGYEQRKGLKHDGSHRATVWSLSPHAPTRTW